MDDEVRPAPPLALTLYWQGERFHALPDGGGLLDQRVRLMRTMNACLSAYEAARSRARAGAGQRARWRSDHPEMDDTLVAVERLRQHGG